MAEVAIIKAAIPVLTQAYNFLKNEVSDAEIYAFSNDVAAVKRAFEASYFDLYLNINT